MKRPSPWLPVPNTEAVLEFKEIAERELGLELTMEDAREVATRVLLIHVMQEWIAEEKREKAEAAGVEEEAA